MDFDREFERYIRRLSSILRKIITHSKESEELRALLEKGEFEMRLFLVPVLFRTGKKGPPKGKRKPSLRFELTEQDRKFLRQVGIRF
ncbi:MAG: hypothetical protein HY590_02405 [Candidatus Omnitrophica bacterium]|nr:hypothetical protein [Candidatus Omnitrophota bacterium]